MRSLLLKEQSGSRPWSGDGTLSVQLARLVPNGEVIGIDASRGMIEAAKPKQQGNLRFLLMDMNNLKVDHEFDVVFSNATLHWVSDHRRLFNNVQRALCSGGVARFNFAGDGNCFHFFKVIRESMALSWFSKYFEGFVWPWYMPSVESTCLLENESRRKLQRSFLGN